MITIFHRFRMNESGATAVEYGLIAALVVVAIIGAVQNLGGKVSATYTNVADAVQRAN